MKHYILILTGLIFAGLFTSLSAQDKETDFSKWKLGMHVGMLQFTGDAGSEFFEVKPSTAGVQLTVARILNPSFDIEGAFMGGNLDFEETVETKVYDLTANVVYKFNNGYILKEQARVAPFLMAGVGGLKSDYGYDLTAPLGAGINFRIDEYMNFQVRSQYKWNSESTFDMFQHSAGFVFNLAGLSKDKVADRDNDGIPDELDNCPDEKGVEALNGCPDSDGDGIADKDDSCPYQAGVAANKGCPEVDEESRTVMQEAIRGIQFETGKAVIKKESLPILDNVAALMERHPEYKLSIEGHTDSQGDDASNLDLSKRRAKAALDYLVKDGVDASRMRSEGYGETKPLGDNSTAAGRAKNRRVEFNIEF